MSWLDQIKNDLTIVTGDGKRYTPLHINAVKEKEYNTVEFNFPGVSGSLVSRRLPKGRRYALELYFQGVDNSTRAYAFESSADGPRPWTLSHPLYGQLTVLPLSLSFDNSKMNSTRVTGTVVETITDQYPRATTNATNQVQQQATTTQAALAAAYGNNSTPSPGDITQQQTFSQAAYTNALTFAPPDLAGDLFNAYNIALALLTNAAAQPLKAMQAQVDLIALPARFEIATRQRFDLLRSTFSTVRAGLQPAGNTPAQKRAYQANNGAAISALCAAAVTPLATDYTRRNDVLLIIEQLLSSYDTYIDDLDNLQTATGSLADSFVPDFDALLLLNNLVNYTIASLFGIALNAKQQRTLLLAYPTNWTSLAHRLYGPSANDENITSLMQQNNAGLSTILQIQANTLIYYYV